ncbi:MAG: hypothetical protein ACLVB5_04765 [Christensenellales bacterium]
MLKEEISGGHADQYLNKMGIPTEKSDRNLSLVNNDLALRRWAEAGVRPTRTAAFTSYCVSQLNPQTETSFTNEKKAENRGFPRKMRF